MKSYEREREREEWNEGLEKKIKIGMSEEWRFRKRDMKIQRVRKGEGKRWGKVREDDEDRGDLMKNSNVIVTVWEKLININSKYEKLI